MRPPGPPSAPRDQQDPRALPLPRLSRCAALGQAGAVGAMLGPQWDVLGKRGHTGAVMECIGEWGSYWGYGGHTGAMMGYTGEKGAILVLDWAILGEQGLYRDCSGVYWKDGIIPGL